VGTNLQIPREKRNGSLLEQRFNTREKITRTTAVMTNTKADTKNLEEAEDSITRG